LLIQTAKRNGIALDHSVKLALSERLRRAMARWSMEPLEVGSLSEAESLISLVRDAPFETDLWDIQNTYYELMRTITDLKPGTTSATWLRLFRTMGDSIGIAVPQIIPPAAERRLAVVALPQPQLSVLAEC
jgi:hypothetical protein